jgi:NAD(P)-dependent dehydrogenase (short-subunit alcohol dehydrogenase family)
VFGYINMCRAVYPAMMARGGGVIVNVLGAAGERPTWGYIAGSAGQCLADGLHPRHGRHQPGRQHPHRRLQSRPDPDRAHGDDAARQRARPSSAMPRAGRS